MPSGQARARTKILLLDPPTFPKGGLSLSLPAVAACLRDVCDVRIVDLNFVPAEEYREVLERGDAPQVCGLKVSAQNLPLAVELSALARAAHPDIQIVWGGELPTLLPDECLKTADSVVQGRFEPQAAAFLADLAAGKLARIYRAEQAASFNGSPPPALDLVENPGRYLQFMGTPVESALGCGEACTFCLVHMMQGKTDYRGMDALAEDLRVNRRRFVNVVDYNIGSRKEHLLAAARTLGESSVAGWMGECCLETLDDAEVLEALHASRCRIMYCGLESLSPAALKTVNKTQNKVDSYRRIIRRAQAHGIEIATGFILGLSGTERSSFVEFADFCEEVGIIALKLTWLTFNPGARIHKSMRTKGRYISEKLSDFDGNHLTFVPEGVRQEELFAGARELIRRFYSPLAAWRRSRHLAGALRRRAEFMLFSHCYGQAYRDWLRCGVLQPSGGGFDRLLRAPLRKGFPLRLAERLLGGLREGAGCR
ncbi:MAG: radical SAM protein [Elusimicrobiota bacterium]